METRMKRLLAASLLVAAVGAALAQEMVAPNANLKADGIPPIEKAIADKVALYTDFRGFGFVDWHPKTSAMLVRHREAGANIAQIHLLREPGGKLERLTDFPDFVADAAFDPKAGKFIVYARDAGGNEATQVFRMDLDTRQSTLLSQPDERSAFAWSERGDRLLVSALPLDRTAKEGKRDDVRTRLTLVDPLHPDQKTKLAELPGGGWGDYKFSRDDRWLAAVNGRTPNDADVVVINVKTGHQEKVLPRPGAPLAGYGNPLWSADGRHLLLVTNQGGEFNELVVYDLASKRLKSLSHHIPWDVDGISLSKDGRRVLAAVNNNGRSELHLFDAASGKELARPDVPAGAIDGGKWHAAHRGVFAFSLNSPQSPGDVYSFDTGSGKAQRWTTAVSPAGVNPDTFVSPELVTLKSFDGLTLSGWLFLPDAKKFPGKRPVRVDFHGGPESQSTVRFMGRTNYLLEEMGVAILLPNVRGSSGYGKTFVDLDNGFKRKDSVKDGGAFLQWIGSHQRLDASRIVVAGGSYGGYMSLATAVDYSPLIRGAIDVVGISNFITFLNNTESYRRDLRRVEYGDERDPKMREFFEKIAPTNNAASIKVPMFIVQGKNDPRVPYTESEQMVAAIRKNGVPVWYLLADNEGHGFRRKANADYEFYATVKFMESVLLK
jgi:dipeptidyl aminopeptidase/acylaminoacyl peptidase